MADAGLIVVPDGTKAAGVVTWWTLHGTIEYETLEREWLEAGREARYLPALPSDRVSLKRALASMEGPKTRVEVLPDSVYALVDLKFDMSAGIAEPEYTVRFKVWFDDEDSTICYDRDLPNDVVDAVEAAFLQARGQIQATDLSSWLVKVVALHSAVALRPTGGIYFIPQTAAPQWTAFAEMLERMSASRVFEVPAMQSVKAVDAILAAVTIEAQAELDAIAKALEENEMTVRGLKGRATRLDATGKKLKLYEDLLGARVQALHDAIEAIDARIVEAIVVAEEDAP